MNVSEDEWGQMFRAALAGQLVPFLGAGASFSVLLTGAQLVRHLKRDVEYPDPDETDLARVAQYVQVIKGREYATEKIIALLKTSLKEHFHSSPHRDLARLPVHIYLTTNYDDLMEYELRIAGKEPISLYPIWHKRLEGIAGPSLGNQSINEIEPTFERPIVYHLHGHWDVPTSILVTEDDYIQFLSALHNPSLLPDTCRKALASDTLVFVGYSLRDSNIRVLLTERGKNRLLSSYAIMLRPENVGLAKFMEMDLAERGLKVLWGTAHEFTNEFLEFPFRQKVFTD